MINQHITDVQADLKNRSDNIISRLNPLASQIQPQLNAMYKLDLQTLSQSLETFQEKLLTLPDIMSTMTDDELRVTRHDLKNVLNIMVGFAFVLHRDIAEILSPDQNTTLQTILADSQALIEVVDQLR